MQFHNTPSLLDLIYKSCKILQVEFLLLFPQHALDLQKIVEEEQTQPEYLPKNLLKVFLKDLQILNEIQPLKQETSNQIQKDQEEKSIVELLAEERLQKANQALNESQSPQEMRIQDLEIQKQQCLEEIKEWMNDLGIREYQKEEIDIDYRRKLRESEARARSQKIIIDDDDDNLGFYAVHPNTIHTPVSQNVEPKDSLIMGDGHINTTPETETISVETLVSNPSITLERRSTLWQTGEAKPQVHNMFHVSNLKKCYADEPLAVLLDGLHLDDKLHFVEEPLEIVGREVKRLKRSRIPLVKVRWNSKRGPEFTWEREDQFKKKYPHLFTKTASSSSAAS
ncbi:hypothetical protein Tco_1272487 [Tanacetum coccineum]